MQLNVFGGFAGLGGAEQAFEDAGDYVCRVDNNPLLKDVKHMTIEDLGIFQPPIVEWDIALFGPPCTEFSNGYNGPRPMAERSGRTWFPNLDCLRLSVEWIEKHKPRFWVIENVVGAIKYFRPYLGEPTQIVGPFVLWHNLPQRLDISVEEVRGHKGRKGTGWSTDPLRANKKAIWPLALSSAVREAVLQPTLEDWYGTSTS